MTRPESFEIALDQRRLRDLRERLAHTAPLSQPVHAGWEYGADFTYLGELCEHWRESYDPSRVERSLNRFSNWRWDGIHTIWERSADRSGRAPVLLLHGWPSTPIELLGLVEPLLGAGHDVVVPSLPGFAFSDPPDPPLNVAGMSARLRALMEALGYERYTIQGGDWGSIIAARIAHDDPAAVAAIHLSSPGVLPAPADLADPAPAPEEIEYAQRARRWLIREGFHLLVQGAAPDALAPALADSPAGLAAWLADKYRRWSDCDGEIDRRFPSDDLCDVLTVYWCTGTIGSSMRLYAAEARARWRLQPGERIGVPAAVADFPAEILRPPRRLVERQLEDLRRWTTFDRGGHFAAFEEPDLLARDLLAFLGELSAPLRLAILSDTHLPRGSRRLPEECLRRIRAADVVLHAGDFSTYAVFERLRAESGRLIAVHGNVDDSRLRAELPERAESELGGVRIAMVHDAGPARGRPARLRRWFPDAAAVIFGHSHIPLHERDGPLQIFNPGSPTERRRSPAHTMGTAEVAGGRIRFRHLTLG